MPPAPIIKIFVVKFWLVPLIFLGVIILVEKIGGESFIWNNARFRFWLILLIHRGSIEFLYEAR